MHHHHQNCNAEKNIIATSHWLCLMPIAMVLLINSFKRCCFVFGIGRHYAAMYLPSTTILATPAHERPLSVLSHKKGQTINSQLLNLNRFWHNLQNRGKNPAKVYYIYSTEQLFLLLRHCESISES